jgi:CBS domain-containing protein
MKVRDIMTRDAVSCTRETSLADAARLMLDGHFGTVPVTDADGKIAGILTDRDIAMAMAATRRSASNIAVHEAMTQGVRTCFEEDQVAAALKQMEEARVRRLPVVDAAGHVAGILSIDDLVLRALDRPGGLSSSAFINTLTRIASRPPVEPGVDFSETFVSG